jgi:hypothetical protein
LGHGGAPKEKKRPVVRRLYKSGLTDVRVLDTDASTIVPGTTTTFGIQIKLEKACHETAICIPSAPMQATSIMDEEEFESLRKWWKTFKHNIYRTASMSESVGPVFLVTKNTTCEQASTCYYHGDKKEARLCLKGNLLDIANLKMAVGWECLRDDNFGFNHTVRQEAGINRSIFLDITYISGFPLYGKVKLFAKKLWK